MKNDLSKNCLIVMLLICAFVLFPGASVWEGAAAVSPDLPETGFFIATNSFPRNTIVNLTNLETGRTIQVTVSDSLEAPGLLALVSREAAESIGLRSRIIGRIRMTAPSDPTAFSRSSFDFRSDDPDYNPLAAVERIYGEEPAPAEIDIASLIPAPPPVTEVLSPEPEPHTPIPIVEVKPETRPQPEPDPETELLVVIPVDKIIVPEPEPEPPIAVVEPEPEPEPEPVIAITEPEPEPEPELEPDPFIAVTEPEPEPEPVIAITEPEPEPVIDPSDPLYGYILVPAEERPPTGGISGTASRDGTAGVPQLFSVPAITELERGRYYLQIGAFSQISAVEQELSRVGRGYPLTIQSIGTTTVPVYRILVGPVNLGESGALLRTFQSQGYRDAFIRRGE